MTNELEKAIRYFKNMRDDNKVVLDSGFGMKKGENNLLYKNRKKYAELAIEALEKLTPKKPVEKYTRYDIDGEYNGDFCKCPNCKHEIIDGFNLGEDYNYCVHCGQKLDWSE